MVTGHITMDYRLAYQWSFIFLMCLARNHNALFNGIIKSYIAMTGQPRCRLKCQYIDSNDVKQPDWEHLDGGKNKSVLAGDVCVRYT